MYEIAPGSTSQSVQFFLRDSVTGQPKGNLAFDTPGARAGYVRQGGSSVGYALVSLAGPTVPWVSGGFFQVDPAPSPGVYRLDVPNAALAAGAGFVTLSLGFDGTFGEAVLVLLRNPTNNVGPGAYTYSVTILRSSDGQAVVGA